MPFPNEETQFTSENQPENRGRPKGSKNFKTLYKQYLSLKMNPEDSGFDIPYAKDGEELTLKEMMVLRHIKKAIGKADYKDIEMIINRLDGKVTEKLEHSGSLKVVEIPQRKDNE